MCNIPIFHSLPPLSFHGAGRHSFNQILLGKQHEQRRRNRRDCRGRHQVRPVRPILLYKPRCKPTVMVITASLRRKMLASVYSFQAFSTVKMATVAIPGRASGMMILINAPNSRAPVDHPPRPPGHGDGIKKPFSIQMQNARFMVV